MSMHPGALPETTETVVPKRGMRFTHTRAARKNDDGVWVHCTCRVTTVRNGVVYFSTDDSNKANYYTDVAKFPAIVAEILPEA